MKIYLVRHGLTRWNKTGRYAGWSDVPLSPAGVEQAERLARCFSGLGPFTLYASDLKRTVITAEIIGRGRGISPVALPHFRELFFGDWEGKTYRELAESCPAQLERWYNDPFMEAPPGGETVAMLEERAWAGLEKVIAATPSGHAAVIVSHGGAIRAILRRCLGLAPESIWDITVENASISLLSRNGPNLVVLFRNYCRHLD